MWAGAVFGRFARVLRPAPLGVAFALTAQANALGHCGGGKGSDAEDTRHVEKMLREGMDKVTSHQESDFQDIAKEADGHFFHLLKESMDTFVPGIGMPNALPSTLATASCMLGPCEVTLITSVGKDGQDVKAWTNTASDFFMNVSPPGTAKSVVADAGVDCIRKVMDFSDTVREQTGGYLPLHSWLRHIHREGKSIRSVTKDGSMAYVFEEISRSKGIMELFMSMDEGQTLWDRLMQSQSPHERGGLLSLWNVASQEKKTGVTVVATPVFKFDLFCNVQPSLLAECIIHEVREGRGLLPRFIMMAGSKKHFSWATGKEANYPEYMKRLAHRMSLGGRAVPQQSDCLANLLIASLVFLNELPRATQASLAQAADELRELSEAGPRTPSSATRASQTVDTPVLMQSLGWHLEPSPDKTPLTPPTPADTASSTSQASASEGAPNAPKKSNKRGPKGHGPSNSKKANNEIDPAVVLAAFESAKKRFVFNAKSQTAMANWLTRCDQSERECQVGDGVWALAPFWRKNKDHAMRLVPIVHALNGGAKLWRETGLNITAPLTMRNLLRLCKTVQDRPHKDGCYTPHALGSYAHVIEEADVRHTVRILNSSMKLTELGFGASQTRAAALLKMPTFVTTAREMSLTHNVTPFQFKEMAVLAERQGLGVYTECSQFGWKESTTKASGEPGSTVVKLSRGWTPNSLQKLGGHPHSFFTKQVIPDDKHDKLTLAARAARSGVTMDVFEASLYPQSLLAAKPSKALSDKLKQLQSVYLSLAGASGRSYLVEQPSAFRDVGKITIPTLTQAETWTSNKSDLVHAHKHFLQLALANHGAHGGTPELPLLDDPPLPGGPPGAKGKEKAGGSAGTSDDDENAMGASDDDFQPAK